MIDEPADSLAEVRLLGLPVSLWSQTREHLDGLLREFTLLTAVSPGGSAARVPDRLLHLVAELRSDYGSVGAQQQLVLAEAADQGRAALDLTYRVPLSAGGACARLDDALDVADEFCRSGEHLLCLAASPEAVAFRRWYLGEFASQIAGQPPVPWPEAARTMGLAARSAG